MNAAIIVGFFPVISETFILQQIIGLIESGNTVHIFSENRPDRHAPIHPEISKYDLLSKTVYLDIPATVKGRILSAPEVVLRTFTRNPRLAFHLINPLRYGRKAFTLSALNRLNNLITKNRNKFDIVHCHYGFIGNDYRFVKYMWKCPLIVSFHGVDCSRYVCLNGVNFYEYLFKEADGITVTGRFMRDRLVAMGCPVDKIYILSYGINVNDYSYKIKFWNRNETLKLLSVARLVEKKGLKYSMEAVAKIKKLVPNLSYQIIGEGPLRPFLQEIIRNFELENIVELKGAVENSLVREAMSEAHIFILPSVTAITGDQEGVPVSLMEASSCGLPVLSTYHSGIPEVILDAQSGFLVPERDVDALVERLTFFIDHPEIWGKMGWTGRQHIEKNYNIFIQNDKLVGIYRDILEKASNKHKQ
jgi:colanic acid/amylovoran biosynthesis glycosyltransferase